MIEKGPIVELNFRDQIRGVMNEAADLDEGYYKLSALFRNLKRQNSTLPITYVAGIVTSDGPQNIDKNMQMLSVYVDRLISDNRFGPQVFSASDVFNRPLFAKFDNAGAENSDYLNFWVKILRTKTVDNLLLTPGWRRSNGATAENNVAKQVKLNIFWANLEDEILKVSRITVGRPGRAYPKVS